jgi:hypothetical protein
MYIHTYTHTYMYAMRVRLVERMREYCSNLDDIFFGAKQLAVGYADGQIRHTQEKNSPRARARTHTHTHTDCCVFTHATEMENVLVSWLRFIPTCSRSCWWTNTPQTRAKYASHTHTHAHGFCSVKHATEMEIVLVSWLRFILFRSRSCWWTNTPHTRAKYASRARTHTHTHTRILFC